MKHKFDKYGCIDENCEEHYPVISRASIIAEHEANEQYAKERDGCQCKRICEKCGLTIK